MILSSGGSFLYLLHFAVSNGRYCVATTLYTCSFLLHINSMRICSFAGASSKTKQ